MNPKRRRWSDAEVRLLKEEYLNHSDTEIAGILMEKFGRKVHSHSIFKKRKSLNLMKDEEIANRIFDKKCIVCQTNFSSPSPNAMYCSEACKQRHYRAQWRKVPIGMNHPMAIQAEVGVQQIFKKLGFSEFLWCRTVQKTFPFDYLIKKDGKLCAFEVTLSQSRSVDEGTRRLISFIGIPMFICHVNPNDMSKVLVNRLKSGKWYSSARGVGNNSHITDHEASFETIYDTVHN